MELTREQEEKLISIGLDTVLAKHMGPFLTTNPMVTLPRNPTKRRRMSAASKRAISQRMKKMWRERKRNKK